MKTLIFTISLFFTFSSMAQEIVELKVIKLKDIDFSLVKTIGTESHGKINLGEQYLSNETILGLEKNKNLKFDLNLASKNILDLELTDGEVIDAKDNRALIVNFSKGNHLVFPSLERFAEKSELVVPTPESNDSLRILPLENPTRLVPNIKPITIKPNPLKPGLIVPNSSNPLLRSGTDIFGGGTGRVVLDEI